MPSDVLWYALWWVKSASLTTWKILNESCQTTNSCYTATRLPSAQLVIRPSTTGRSATTHTDSKTLDDHPISSSIILSAVPTSEMTAVGRPANMNYSVTTPTPSLRSFSTRFTTRFLTAAKGPQQISLSVPSTRKGVVTPTHKKKKPSVARFLNLCYLKHCRRKKTSCSTI